MQTDGGFVKHVEDAGERSPSLTCQPNSLRFTPGECGHAAIQCEVIEADFDEEIQSVGSFVRTGHRRFVVSCID
jgi:hypothetical protein